jgi:argininosuccinate synthase
MVDLWKQMVTIDSGIGVKEGGMEMGNLCAGILEKLGFSIRRVSYEKCGDTIIGIKGRVGFEAAAPMLIIAAHRMLEKHTQTKWQIYWKEQVANWYGMFLHEAQYLEPVMRDIEAMLASSQRNVTGTVELILRPYSYTLVGVDSTFDLMKTDFGEYGEVNKAWTADDVKGFTKILGNQIKIYHNVQKRNKK